MSFNNLSAGSSAPNVVNVVIEISACSTPVKYEVNKSTGLLHVDRFLSTPMHYPCNYGYVPMTLSGDGDPVDVLVVTPFPVLAGSVIEVRPVGMLEMTDEKGQDRKVLAVPTQDISLLYRHVHAHTDLPQDLLDQIEHFFTHYKDLEHKKWVKIDGWQDTNAAIEEIASSIRMHQQHNNLDANQLIGS